MLDKLLYYNQTHSGSCVGWTGYTDIVRIKVNLI